MPVLPHPLTHAHATVRLLGPHRPTKEWMSHGVYAGHARCVGA
jgi:hypothetical protein